MVGKMSELPMRLVHGEDVAADRHGKHKLDELDASRVARHLVLFRPSEAAVEELMAKARLSVPNLGATDDVLRVLRYNPDCMFAVARKSRFNPIAPAGEGFVAILPLNPLGLQLLAIDALNTANPDIRFLAKPGERPAGIYMWCVFAPGPLAGCMALFMERIAGEPYAGVNLYSRPNTETGTKFNEALGLTHGVKIGQVFASHLWVFPRTPPAPIYDSYSPDAAPGEVSVGIARTFEDLARVISVRSAVYVGQQECPYEEEFDGNDLCATHLLSYVGHEPAGCMRVRFFADFAKIERLAIREEFRKSRAAFQLVRAGFRLCQKKGYTRVYGHSQKRLVNFWSRFGFKVMEGAQTFAISDFDYIEIVADIARDPDCVSLGAGPYAIIRPEGRWHLPGILERSAARPVTCPSVDRR